MVTTKDWKADKFTFRKGVFQGDPWSPLIFLLCLNPIIEFIKLKEDKIEYDMAAVRVASLPFADDFCLISSNQKSHEKTINEIAEKRRTKSMGFQLKPQKCRSISIQRNTTKQVRFMIDDYPIKTASEEPE